MTALRNSLFHPAGGRETMIYDSRFLGAGKPDLWLPFGVASLKGSRSDLGVCGLAQIQRGRLVLIFGPRSIDL